MGYYYETAITGVPEVDEISNAVECAGYQPTQEWTERDANGRCVVDNIDDALRACADTITTLREQLAAAQRQRLREERILATLEGWSVSDKSNLSTVVSRITEYLDSGGLWNPELADHAAVRDLILDARDEIDRLRRIIVAMPNPIARKMLDRDGIDEASDEQWREAVDDANRAICAAVAAAEQEVGRE